MKSKMSFDLGDLRSQWKPMECVTGNWPLVRCCRKLGLFMLDEIFGDPATVI